MDDISEFLKMIHLPFLQVCCDLFHPPGFSSTFQCDGMEGRYINIVIPGRKEYLTLCEVEVYGSPLDWKALKKIINL